MLKRCPVFSNPKFTVIRVRETYPFRTLTTSPPITLFGRLFPASNPNVSVVPILDQWVKEERSVELNELRKIIKQFRKFRRIKHALQISQWMSGKSFLDLSSTDVAVQLDLISKVHGVTQAEEYFNGIPNSSKNFQIYGALLNCYAEAKLLEKAEAVMQIMREFSYAKTLSYNIMLKLYSSSGKQDKLNSLVQEMEAKGIEFNKFTYNIRLNAYADALDIDQMENLLMKMEADVLVTMDWHAYVVTAKGYLRTGNMVKALASLKKSEHLVAATSRKYAYEIYMTMYASLGNKKEVYRIWNLYRKHCKFYSLSYLCMMSALEKLDDLDGTQKVFNEWVAKKATFDIRLPNFLITAFCKKGLLEKAESILQWFLENGKEPNMSTWTRIAVGYQKENQMEKAVEALNKSILASEPDSKLHVPVLDSCLKYLNKKGDLEGIEHLRRLIAERGLDYADVFERLGKKSEEETNPGLKAFDQTKADEEAFKEEMLEGVREGR